MRAQGRYGSTALNPAQNMPPLPLPQALQEFARSASSTTHDPGSLQSFSQRCCKQKVMQRKSHTTTQPAFPTCIRRGSNLQVCVSKSQSLPISGWGRQGQQHLDKEGKGKGKAHGKTFWTKCSPWPPDGASGGRRTGLKTDLVFQHTGLGPMVTSGPPGRTLPRRG